MLFYVNKTSKKFPLFPFNNFINKKSNDHKMVRGARVLFATTLAAVNNVVFNAEKF